MGSRLLSAGSYLPRTVVYNDFFPENLSELGLSKHASLSEIRERRHAKADETSVFMGVEAGKKALERAELRPEDIDVILCHSVTPDSFCPSDGFLIMKELGLKNARCWNLNTACSSFLTSLKCAQMLINSGDANRVLVVGVCTWVNRAVSHTQDFSGLGDGAGAFVLEKSEEESFIGAAEVSDPAYSDMVVQRLNHGSPENPVAFFNNAPSFLPFMRFLMEAPRQVLKKTDTNPGQIDWFIANQPCPKALQTWCSFLEIDFQKNLNTYAWTGHMTVANIPIIFEHYFYKEQKIKRGDTILFFAPGAGMHNVSVLWKF